eukprot:GHVO01069858.1.p1 GENE.GHVO01069858.1~~GHVO01069858.1.p1  ORF type:complete len:119 (-),score=10.02 GHVO01069858.1:50-406(-)
MMFTMSALNPKTFGAVAERCAKLLRPGGQILFRDYGRLDMAQIKFARSSKAKIDENCYVRQDGTLAYYFLVEELRDLFCRQCGLEELNCGYQFRRFKNRKTGAILHRVWIIAKFRKPF